MKGLLQLAKRCEKAVAPSHELFTEIFVEVFPKPTRIWITDNTGDWTPDYSAWAQRQWAFQAFMEANAFTDAALTLVPEGALWKTQHTINIGDDETFECPKGEPPRDFRAGVGIGNVPMHWEHGRSFASAALALCAAALRARAAKAS